MKGLIRLALFEMGFIYTRKKILFIWSGLTLKREAKTFSLHKVHKVDFLQGWIKSGFEGCEGRGAGWGGGGSVEPLFDLKFYFHGKFWIHLINVGQFSLNFSSASPFYYL